MVDGVTEPQRARVLELLRDGYRIVGRHWSDEDSGEFFIVMTKCREGARDYAELVVAEDGEIEVI